MALRAFAFLHDREGAPVEPVPLADGLVEKALAQIKAYLADPYSNLGFCRAVNRNKSHPGTYERRRKAEPEPAGADD